MEKNKDVKGLLAMLKNVSGTKTIDLIHRGSLLRLLGNAVYPDQRADVTYSYLVRLPFGDFGDLTVDNHCIDYLKACKKTLDEEFHFEDCQEELKKNGEKIDDRLYYCYRDWLAICAVFDFLYIGDRCYDAEQSAYYGDAV